LRSISALKVGLLQDEAYHLYMRAKSKEQKAAEVEEAAAAKLRQEEETRQENERKMLARCIKVRPATLRGL
jgi:hypothetical protein